MISLRGVTVVIPAVRRGDADRVLLHPLTLDLAERGPLAAHAREAAFDDAQDKAQQYAALAGARLGRVLAVVEGGGVPGFEPMAGRRDAMMSMKASAGGMPVEAGEHSVGATVRVAWELVPE